jgi:lipopolysaccharide export system ATP-binding protein
VTRVVEFAEGLRPHEASVGVALLSLLRRADASGTLQRGNWLAALRADHGAAVSESPEGVLSHAGGGLGAASHEELGQYLEEHVLARLESEGIAHGDPRDESWERACFDPAIWAEIEPRRDAVIEAVDAAVRNLLRAAVRGPVGDGAVRRPTVLENGSTLSARGLGKAFRKRKVVSDVDVAVAQGEIVGLLGPNGAGKTTTFYMMVGLIGPDQGKVFLDDRDLTRVPMYKRARLGVGYLSQEPSIFRKLNVEDNILAILETLPLSRAERKSRLERLLDELGIRHLRKSKAYSLSGGERRRLEITRALVSEPKFMLLDEPFAGVDPIAVHDIQQIVADLRLRGIGVIISDHNVEQTLDIVDRAYIMYDGRVRVSGTVAELVWNEEVAEIYFGPTLTARMRERYRRPEIAV